MSSADTSTYIANAQLHLGGGPARVGSLLIEGERIARLDFEASAPPAHSRIVEAGSLHLAPGYIDLQVNGGFGYDFTTEPESLWRVAALLPQFGVSSFLPTIITSPLETIERAQDVLAAGPPAGWVGAEPLGLHLEGPYLAPAKKGAHSAPYLRPPNLQEVATWSLQSGVSLVTLAPEIEGALELVRVLSERGIVLSAGHSLANSSESLAAFEAGVRYATHLFNAMPPLNHREPALPGTVLAQDGWIAGLIPDGVHVAPDVVKLAWRAKGPRGLNLVTDAMAALGMPDGRYGIGAQEVIVQSGEARLADGTLAGSVLDLATAVRNLIKFSGCSLPEATTTVGEVPARLLGCEHERGMLREGALADLVLLDEHGEVQATWLRGKRATGEQPNESA